ncbi:MAG TPA: hypothetical protein VHG08_22750 [Longimicrobium sp.]|nr:hypothetical protein [Longimicrobium sp.]
MQRSEPGTGGGVHTGAAPVRARAEGESPGERARPPPTDALTPSERVLIAGERFSTAAAGPRETLRRALAPRVPSFAELHFGRGTTFLLDGTTRVEARSLAISLVRAALLASQRASAIDLRQADDGTLTAVPTGTIAWPADTLEARLLPDAPVSVRDLVHGWLGSDSDDPWRRVVERAYIVAVVRGIARVRLQTLPRGHAYSYAEGAREAIGEADPAPAYSLLRECREERRELWESLERAISAGVNARHYRGDANAFSEVDAWEDESAVNRERHRPEHPAPRWTTYLMAAVLAALAALAVLKTPGGWKHALLTAAVVAPMVWSGRNLRPTGSGGVRWEKTGVPESIANVVILVSFVMFFTVGILGRFPLGFPLLAAGLGVLAYNHLKHWSAVVISSRVRRDAAARPCPAPATGPEVPAAAETPSAPPAAPERLPLSLEIVAPGEMAAPSGQSMERLRENSRRALVVRRIRFRGLAGLVTGYMALALAFWLSGAHGSRSVALWLLGWMGVLLLSRAVLGGKLRQLPTLLGQISGSERTYDPHAGERWFQAALGAPAYKAALFTWWGAKSSIQPWGLLALTAVWMMVVLLSAPLYFAGAGDTRGAVFSALCLSVVLSCVVWTRRALRRVERAHPCQPPLRLLMLRVFGDPEVPDLGEFFDLVALTRPWLGVGLIQRLDGPGTTGRKASDVLNLLTHRVEDSVVEDAAELERELGRFTAARDRALRFGVNSLQCTEATWKLALGRLLASADVVVMDLASLTSAHRGCAYELGRLVDEVPLSRVILLVSDSTDMDFLRETLDGAWAQMAPGSPNRAVAHAPLRLFRTGIARRQDTESEYDRRRRGKYRLDPFHFSGLLCDAALPARSGTVAEPAAPPPRWARRPLSTGLRVAMDVSFALLVIAMVLSTVAVLAGP